MLKLRDSDDDFFWRKRKLSWVILIISLSKDLDWPVSLERGSSVWAEAFFNAPFLISEILMAIFCRSRIICRSFSFFLSLNNLIGGCL